MIKTLRRFWMPLLIAAVVAVGAFAVDRVRQIFAAESHIVTPIVFADDPEPFDPKVVTYEIFGTPGAVVDINYLDLDARTQRVNDVTLPWSITLSTTAPSALAHIVAQGNADHIGCRIIVDGELRVESVSTGVNAQTYCIEKSA
ncbi:MmpS family transport accessory protein [Mycolicibacterium thermoresistibile]|jgi:hypothetical protein|nr:MmpS family transport accessory protein [Mycolicibacterium thermoresistibile]MCV7190762.1 hypothetical protein [Mycolicibacterium thermoresistibile]GAT16823.1 membrane protein mmpS5 [Mycolicibacterium thermoresistibile]SNW17950.1 MmpS5 protein [Mycolicibacterium thermoresistibile]